MGVAIVHHRAISWKRKNKGHCCKFTTSPQYDPRIRTFPTVSDNDWQATFRVVAEKERVWRTLWENWTLLFLLQLHFRPPPGACISKASTSFCKLQCPLLYLALLFWGLGGVDFLHQGNCNSAAFFLLDAQRYWASFTPIYCRNQVWCVELRPKNRFLPAGN